MVVKSTEIWADDEAETSEVLRAYRHCDGYPEGMGLDIAKACAAAERLWKRKNNRNWCQPFLHYIMGTDADIEVEPSDCQHGDIEFLYVVNGTRDLSWGKVDVDAYNISIAVYVPDRWDADYSEIMDGEPVFSGNWHDMIDWLEVPEERLRGDE